MEPFSGNSEQFVPNVGETAAYPVEKAVAFIEANKENVDYQKMWGQNTPVLILGESFHSTSAPKEEIIAQMPTFKQLGATHLAMEMIRDDQQEIVDQFLAGSFSAQVKLYKIFKQWAHTSDSPMQWRDMLQAAKKGGLKIVGIDKNMGEEDSTSDEAVLERNIHWTGILKGIVANNPSARIVAYCGADHCGYHISPAPVNELLQAEGIASTVVHYIGGQREDKELTLADTKANFALAAQQAKVSKQKFALNLSSLGHTRPADYFIHLPQTELPHFAKVVMDRVVMDR